MIILNAIQSVFTIFFMISIGYILTARGWFDEKTQRVFSRLVTGISLPCFMVSNLTSNFSGDNLREVAIGSILPFGAMIITYSIAIVLSKILKIRKERRGIFRVAFALSNTIFIGLPVNISLFGDISVPYVMLYYIANTTFFWTIGVYDIGKATTSSTHLFSKDNIKKIFNPSIISFFITIALIALNIKLPHFLMDGFKYIGNLTTPLSTLFIGIVLHSLKLSDIKIDRDVLLILLGRFILAPAAMFLILFNIDLPLLMKEVFIIQSAMPVMTQTAIVANSYGGDYKYATILGTISTAASLVFIPIYMISFTYI